MKQNKPATASRTSKTNRITAKKFIRELSLLKTKTDLEKNQRFYRQTTGDDNECMGIRMSAVFALAKKFSAMPLSEIAQLLESRFYEARMGAVSIIDFQARDRKISEAERKELFDLYIKRHDRINNWDLVDRSAPYVVGGYLADKSRDILYKLARSKNVWERRTAIVSTYFFIRKGDIIDTFKIAEQLVNDDHDLIHKAVGSWIREAGKRDEKMLIAFLDKHAESMPRTMLRYAVEKLPKKKKEMYLK